MGKESINGGFFRIYYLLLFFLPLKIKGAFFMTSQLEKNNKKEKLFTTRKIAGMAIFTALSFAAYLIEIPIFPAPPANVLKLDFSNVFVMLAGFMYGPLAAVIVTVLKEALHLFVGTTMGVGECANIILTTAYVLFPSILYKYKKGLKNVGIGLLVGSILQIVLSLVVNRFINVPFFIWMYKMPITPYDFFYGYKWYISVLILNGIKVVTISMLTIILYKRVASIFEKIKLK